MAIKRESKLGDYVVSFGLATRREVDACRKGLRPGEMLGQALSRAKPKTCDHKTIEVVARIKKLYDKTAPCLPVKIVLDKSTFIGDILVSLGLVSPEAKEEALAYQASERAAGRDPGLLGSLLIQRGACSSADVELGMKVQRWLRGVK
jgi:hypothetical protein